MVVSSKFDKKEKRNTILQVAKKLFLEKGYDGTTTEEIAKKSNVETETLSNLFETKIDILLETFSEDFVKELNKQEKDLDEIDVTRSAADLVYEFIFRRMKRYSFISKKIQQQILTVVMSAFKSKPGIMKKMIGVDFMFVDELIVYLNELKEKQILDAEFDSNEAAEVIYSSLGFEYLIYLYQEEHSKAELENGIKRKLKFIL